jgi:hypothetical protein
MLEMHHVGNYEVFISLRSYNENEDCEEANVEQIAVKTQGHQKNRKAMGMT